jgi:hypothetical protein
MIGKSIYGCKYFWIFALVVSTAVFHFPNQSPFLVTKYNDAMVFLVLLCKSLIERLPDLVQGYVEAERLAFTVVSVISLEMTFWSWNGVLFVMYKYDLFRAYAVHDGLPSEEMIFEAFLDAVIGHFFVRPPLLYLAFPLFQSDGWMSGEALPSLPTFLAQVFFCLCVDDTIFYWSHRGLHHPSIYKYIHKKHHLFKVRGGAKGGGGSTARHCISVNIPPSPPLSRGGGGSTARHSVSVNKPPSPPLSLPPPQETNKHRYRVCAPTRRLHLEYA